MPASVILMFHVEHIVTVPNPTKIKEEVIRTARSCWWLAFAAGIINVPRGTFLSFLQPVKSFHVEPLLFHLREPLFSGTDKSAYSTCNILSGGGRVDGVSVPRGTPG